MARISIRRITITYVAALGLLAILLIVSYFILRAIIIEQASATRVISNSGRQRMLSQRIAMFSLLLVVDKSDEQKKQNRMDLSESINEMEEGHNALIFGSESLDIEAAPPQIRSLYFNPPLLLNKQVQDYLTQARVLAAEQENELNLRNPHLQFILSAAQDKLLNSLDSAVNKRQEISQNLIVLLEQILVLIFTVLLLVIILEAFLVFLPMTRRINSEASALSKLYEQEQKIADTLQKSLVPKEVPNIEDLELKYFYQSATKEAEVGGDFYDFFRKAGTNKWVIAIGDVAGKGIDAAAETAKVKYLLRDRALSHESAEEILASLNRTLVIQRSERFTALMLAIYDYADSTLEISNSGNPYPYIASGDKFLELSGVPLSLFLNQKYEKQVIDLQEDQVIIMYTDGLIEARCQTELFGEKRVRNYVQENINLNLEDLIRGIVAEARAFSKDNLTDDILVIGLKKKTK